MKTIRPTKPGFIANFDADQARALAKAYNPRTLTRELVRDICLSHLYAYALIGEKSYSMSWPIPGKQETRDGTSFYTIGSLAQLDLHRMGFNGVLISSLFEIAMTWDMPETQGYQFSDLAIDEITPASIRKVGKKADVYDATLDDLIDITLAHIAAAARAGDRDFTFSHDVICHSQKHGELTTGSAGFPFAVAVHAIALTLRVDYGFETSTPVTGEDLVIEW